MLIMVLLDGCSHRAANANTITSHYQRSALALIIKHHRCHGFGILGSEFENVTDLNPPPTLKTSAFTTRTGVTLLSTAQISKAVNSDIARVTNSNIMAIDSIATNDIMTHGTDFVVGKQANIQTDRAGKPGRRAGHALHDFLFGRKNPVDIQLIGELNTIKFAITAQQHSHNLFGRGLQDQGFHQTGRRQFKKISHLLDGFPVRSSQQLQALLGGYRQLLTPQHLSFLYIGGIFTGIAGNNSILPRFCEHHKFMGRTAANRTTIGFYRTKMQATTLENITIGLIHFLVGEISTGIVKVKRIGILHNEFAPPHETKTRPDLIAKLGLNLIQIEG